MKPTSFDVTALEQERNQRRVRLSVTAVFVVVATVAVVALVGDNASQERGTKIVTQRRVQVEWAKGARDEPKMMTKEEEKIIFENCLKKLNTHRARLATKMWSTKEQISTDEKSSLFPISDDGKYHFVDDKGDKHQVNLKEASLKRFGILTGLTNQAHKITRRPNGELGILYDNNVAVTVDATPSTCRVTNVYENTNDNDVHPDAASLKSDSTFHFVNGELNCGYYSIQGVKSGGYLRYDTDFNGLVSGRQEIDAAATVGDWEKWEFILKKDSGAKGAAGTSTSYTATYAVYFNVRHAREKVVYKDLAMAEIATNEWNVEALVPSVLSRNTGSNKQVEGGVAWNLYESKQEADGVYVTLPNLLTPTVTHNVVLLNELSGKCLCINSKSNNDANAVTGCTCTDANSQLKLASTAKPADFM